MNLETNDAFRRSAPDDGADRAQRRGAQLRRRRHALVASAGGAGVAIVLGVVALSGGASRPDSLQVANDPRKAASPTATGTTPSVAGGASPVAQPTSLATPAGPGPTMPSPLSPSPSASRTPRPAEPGMTRTYDKAPVNVGGTFCDGGVGAHGVDRTSICGAGSVAADQADAQHRIPVSGDLCEDQAEVNGITLHYPSDREIDFAVYRGSTVVWRWSAGRPPARKVPHTLRLDPGRCWAWTTSWRAVDSRGHALTGDFTLRTTWSAQEFAQSEDWDFTL